MPARRLRSAGFLAATRSASKKTLHAAEQDRPDVAEARQKWKAGQASPDRQGSLRPLENHHLHRRTALRRLHRRMGAGRGDGWSSLPDLCRKGAGSNPQAGRHRGHGQSSCPQSRGRAKAESKPYRPACSICRPIHPPSTLSRWPLQSSRRCCARLQIEPGKPSGTASARSSTPSHQTNVQTTSLTQDMRQISRRLL